MANSEKLPKDIERAELIADLEADFDDLPTPKVTDDEDVDDGNSSAVPFYMAMIEGYEAGLIIARMRETEEFIQEIAGEDGNQGN